METLTRIYVLKDSDGNIRYVGKTKHCLSNRLARHMKETRKGNYYRAYWVRQQAKEGKPISIELVEEVRGGGCEREVFWIAEYRRLGCKLVNTTEGGEGISGFKFSKETIAKIAAANRKVFGDPAKRKSLSENAKARWRNLPTSEREAHCAKLKEAGLARRLANSMRPKHEKVRLTEEEKRARHSEGTKKWHASMTEEQKVARIESYKRAVASRTPERRAEMRVNMQKARDPAVAAEIARKQWAKLAPERRKEIGAMISAGRKKRYLEMKEGKCNEL